MDLRGLTFQKVLDALMLQTDMFYKVMDPNTIMVFKKTPQNLSEYENKLIQTFYLSNAEVDNVRQIFSALLPQVRAFSDKRLNALTVLAKASDLAVGQPHRPPAGQGQGGSDDLPGAAGSVRADRGQPGPAAHQQPRSRQRPGPLFRGRHRQFRRPARRRGRDVRVNPKNGCLGDLTLSGRLSYLLPAARLDMAQVQRPDPAPGQPQRAGGLRRDRGGQHQRQDPTTQSSIGPPTSAAATPGANATAATLAGTLATQTTYSYEDVGVKIKVKPRVHFNGDITIDLESDVTTLAGGQPATRGGRRSASGSSRPPPGSRTARPPSSAACSRRPSASTSRASGASPASRCWATCWATRNTDDQKTDVILSIKAVVVRTADLREADFEPFDPDQAPNRFKPFTPQAGKPAAQAGTRPAPVVLGPAPAASPAPAPVPQAAPEKPAEPDHPFDDEEEDESD